MAAGNSIIGALRVDLGLNSAQFTEGLKQATGALGKFGVQLTYSLNGIVDKIGELAKALPEAIKGSIDHADALSKAAQKAGVTVEALSRLSYAAQFSEIDLDTLTSTLGKLSKNMADAATNATGPVATAFKALGVSVTDSSGHLRDAGAVFTDVAEKFSKLPDGATKTALAIQIFGKAGAQLIPVLNEGADGLKAYADEADRLGITISTKTADAANKFNDTLTKVQAEIDGIVNQLAADLLPLLQQIADWFASPEFQDALNTWVKSAVSDLTQFATLAQQIVGILNDIDVLLDRTGKKGGPGPAPYSQADYNNALRSALDDNRVGLGAGEKYGASANSLYSGFSFTNGKIDVAGSATDAVVPKFTAATKAVKDWSDEVDGAITKAQDLAASIGDTLTGAVQGFFHEIEQGVNPLKALVDQLGDLASQLADSAIQSFFGSIFSPNFIGGTAGAPALRLGFQVGVPHAMGGPVSAGVAYPVGEKGPEMFVPGQDGTIIPNGALVGRGGQVVNNVYNYSSAKVQTETNSTGGVDTIVAETERQIKDHMARGQYAHLGITPGVKRS